MAGGQDERRAAMRSIGRWSGRRILPPANDLLQRAMRRFGPLDSVRRLLGRFGIWSRREQQVDLGEMGERIAAQYLQRHGLRIVARHVRDSFGEIDLIGVERRTIVFVEVKTRRSDAMGHPLESVTAEKQQRLTRLALAYLRRNDLLECAARFDVVAITLPTDDACPVIEHIRNAFEPTQAFQFFG